MFTRSSSTARFTAAGLAQLSPAVLALCVAATAGLAADEPAPASYHADLSAPHLNVIPRTRAEAARIGAALKARPEAAKLAPFEDMPAGAATVRLRAGRDAFSQPSANMPFERVMDFKLGEALFEKLWVSSPSSTKASDGLGPLYNARSCGRCHVQDGRGHTPETPQDSATSMVLRLSVPAPQDAPETEIESYLAGLGHSAPRSRPAPVLGQQLQDFAAPGHAAEGRLAVSYTPHPVTLADGTVVTLRRPTYAVADPAHGALPDDLQLSARIAPQMIGLGLLEAIPAADILATADPDDADGDGISGKAQVVWSAEFQRPMLGRFGWKAGHATVRDQSAAAFSSDIGISSPLFPAPAGDCTAHQAACLNGPHGDGDVRQHEVDRAALDLVTFYAANLGVPARRSPAEAQVLRGRALFHQAGCADCHRPAFVTHRLQDQPEQSFQLIWPYSDLLLHDMGEGLADPHPEGRALGREWRTAPLWGIGLTKQVGGVENYLHDGRARTLLEAILWHGGEAEPARDALRQMPKQDRDALIRYLESL